VHVEDICAAVLCVLSAPREVVRGQILNVGDTQANYQVKEHRGDRCADLSGCRLSFGTRDADIAVTASRSRRSERSYRTSDAGMTGQGRAQLRGSSAHRLVGERFGFRAFTRLEQLKYLIPHGQIDGDCFWTGADSVSDDGSGRG